MALVAKQFSKLITFTRASGGGRFNASGQYEWLAANVPRIDYDPITGECLGILVEEQRTNLFPRSSVFSNLKEVTITAGAVTSPSGAQDGSHVVPSTVNSEHYTDDLTVSLTAGNWYTFSTHVKSDGINCILRMRIALAMNLAFTFNLAMPSVPTDTSTEKYGYTKLPNDWYRVWVSFQATATGGAVIRHQLANATAQIVFAGDGVSGIYLWGRQFEQGAFPTSYIPTSGAQVTRAADVASVNTLRPWFNAVEGTIVAEFSSLSASAAAPSSICGFDDGTTNNRMYLRATSGRGQQVVVVGGATAVVSDLGAVASNVPMKIAGTFKADDFAGSLSGGTAVADTAGAIPIVTKFNIGSRGAADFLNGHIKSLRYYPKRLTNAELQELTA